MTSKFMETMKTLSDSTNLEDKELFNIVDENSKRTKIALSQGAQDNEKFQKFLVLQGHIAKNAEDYLTRSRSAFEKFSSLVKNPSATGFQRLGATLSLGLYKPEEELSPSRIANIVLDLYNAQTEHLGAVQTSHDILQNRRKLVYGIARDAAEGIRDHSLEYHLVKLQKERIENLFQTVDNFTQGGELSIDELKQRLEICSEANLFDGSDLLARIDGGEDIRPDLYLVREDVDLARATIDDKYRGEGLEVKGGLTLLQGLDLQKRQFDETIKGQGAQVQQLEIDLRLTKENARNSFYLSRAQGTSQSAMEGFLAYRDTMNQVQLFNSLGARVMLDRVGFIMTTPFYDPEILEQAKDELNQAAGIFAQKEEFFHGEVEKIVDKLGLPNEMREKIQYNI